MIEYLISGGIASAGIFYGLYQARQTKQAFRRMDDILDEAIAGKMEQREFSESYTSKLEEKLGTFLQTKQRQKQMLSSEEERVKELISNIAHQTKTPLTNISIYSQLLSEKELPDPEEKYVHEISTQTEKLTFFIENLVKTSYLENELIQVKPHPGSLHDLIEEAVASIQAVAQKKSIQVSISPIAENLTASFDPRWTKEALLNVLDNAVKYSPANTEITVKIVNLESYFKIDVLDEGAGISEEQQGAIFQRFYRGQADNQTDGLGIGLYLARKILQRQGGFIKVKSAPGTGSAFSLFLKK